MGWRCLGRLTVLGVLFHVLAKGRFFSSPNKSLLTPDLNNNFCLLGDIKPDAIRLKLIENIIEKRDKTGTLLYPKLRLPLTTCWGYYAWNKDST